MSTEWRKMQLRKAQAKRRENFKKQGYHYIQVVIDDETYVNLKKYCNHNGDTINHDVSTIIKHFFKVMKLTDLRMIRK